MRWYRGDVGVETRREGGARSQGDPGNDDGHLSQNHAVRTRSLPALDGFSRRLQVAGAERRKNQGEETSRGAEGRAASSGAPERSKLCARAPSDAAPAVDQLPVPSQGILAAANCRWGGEVGPSLAIQIVLTYWRPILFSFGKQSSRTKETKDRGMRSSQSNGVAAASSILSSAAYSAWQWIRAR